MIQFNLLPSVKLEYVKAKRNKRITIIIASLVGTVSLAIFILLFVVVQVLQKKYSNDLSKDIKTESSKLEKTEDLNKILTIQNQLNSLTKLHDDKPVVTRLFGYLKQITPTKVSIATLNIDYDLQTINVTGSADSISTVNVFVDTLKFTNYTATKTDKDRKQDPQITKGNAFSAVVLSGYGLDTKGASYQISLKFDPNIFSNLFDEVTITVPKNKITTRSETERPGDNPESLFQPLSKPKEGNQ